MKNYSVLKPLSPWQNLRSYFLEPPSLVLMNPLNPMNLLFNSGILCLTLGTIFVSNVSVECVQIRPGVAAWLDARRLSGNEQGEEYSRPDQ